MGVLRIKVECNRCKNIVDKLDAMELASLTRTPRYECYNCFRKYSHTIFDGQKPIIKAEEKQPLYCERCRYKFSSKRFVCPYCNGSDKLIKSNISIQDII